MSGFRSRIFIAVSGVTKTAFFKSLRIIIIICMFRILGCRDNLNVIVKNEYEEI